MAKTRPIEFLKEVQKEFSKIKWPSRRETVAMSIMVLVLSAIMAIFFLVIDTLMAGLVNSILNFGA